LADDDDLGTDIDGRRGPIINIMKDSLELKARELVPLLGKEGLGVVDSLNDPLALVIVLTPINHP
jgi:hypothetical protein